VWVPRFDKLDKRENKGGGEEVGDRRPNKGICEDFQSSGIEQISGHDWIERIENVRKKREWTGKMEESQESGERMMI